MRNNVFRCPVCGGNVLLKIQPQMYSRFRRWLIWKLGGIPFDEVAIPQEDYCRLYLKERNLGPKTKETLKKVLDGLEKRMDE